jgi:uncharacterized membrane protein YoaK (UPF0700 family)
MNATAYIACERFVSHVTGTFTSVGLRFGQFWLLLDFAVVCASFVAGAMFSAFLINARAHRGKRPLHTLPLVLVVLALVGTALAGHWGWLGKFGGDVDELGDFIMLTVLSFASGLQNGAVATSTGQLVRTTHLTGPATDLGIHLVEIGYLQGDARSKALRQALLRAGKITAFVLGAVVAVPLTERMQFLTLLVSAGAVALAAGLTFVPHSLRAIRKELGRA